MQCSTSHETDNMENSTKLGSSNSLSLGDNKEEFTEGKESSVKLMNFYLDFFFFFFFKVD